MSRLTMKVIALAVVFSAFAMLLNDANAGESRKSVQPTSGEYMGHKWRIDENHMMWWDGKPYIRYGFSGNPKIEELDRFIELGFNQFYAKGEKFTQALVDKGCTYYAGLNGLWPREENGEPTKLADEDKFHTLTYRIWKLEKDINKEESLKLSFLLEKLRDFDKKSIKFYLIDMTGGKYEDISEKLQDIKVKQEEIKESEFEIFTGYKYILNFEKFELPESKDLKLLMVSEISSIECMDAFGWETFPALWRPNVIEYYKNNLKRSGYAKEGLRGMQFWDHINASKISLLHDDFYPNYNGDDVFLKAYRKWLEEKYENIENLNKYLNSDHESFKNVNWQVPPYPSLLSEYFKLKKDLDEKVSEGGTGDSKRAHRAYYELLGSKEGEIEQSDETSLWATVSPYFNLLPSADRLKKMDALQDEFRIWFYGHWLANYANMAREIIGNVPVFITTAGLDARNADWLFRLHEEAMLQGIDGLIRNQYGHVKKTEDGEMYMVNMNSMTMELADKRDPIENVTKFLDLVENKSGKTKHYWTNEIGWPKLTGPDDFGMGEQWAFTSKEDMRNFMLVLIENGYKGFNLFAMDPEHPSRAKEVKWYLELKDEIIKRTIETTEFSKGPKRIEEKK